MSIWRRLAPVFALLLITAVPLWRALIGGQAIGEFDAVRHMAPWNGPAPAQPWDVLQADSVLQFYPWRHMVLDAWGKHQLPLWNPYELAGTPLLANSQSAGFYPPHIVLGLLHVPTAPAMTLLAWFHLVLAAWGVYVLSRRLGAGRLGALVGGSSFSLSVFMLDWTALPSVPATVAWIPWVLAGITSIFDFRFQIFDCMIGIAGTAFCVAMMFLAGHLQFAAYGCMAAVLFILGFGLRTIRKAPKQAGIGASCCVAALVLGGMMASPQVLPVLQFSKLSPRQNQASAKGYEGYVNNAIQPFELANLSVANALGSPRETASVKVNDRTISAYWPLWPKRGANLAESAVTIGPLVLGLLVLAPWKRRETWIVAAMAVLALLIALGTPINALFYYGIPGWSATGSPGRIIVLFVLGACVLAALAVDRPRELVGAVRLGVLALPLAVGALCAALLPAFAPDAGGTIQIVNVLRGAATSEALMTLLLSSVLAALGLAVILYPQASKYRLALAACPLLIAWVGYASNLVLTGEPLPVKDSADSQRVAVVNTDWPIQLAPNAIYPPNTASLEGIHELGGYDSLLDGGTVQLLEGIDQPDGTSPPENGNMMFIKPTADKKKLADAGVTKIFWPPAGGGLTDYRVEDLPGPGRVSATGGTATIVEDGYDHQVLEVSPGVTSVLERDRNLPGWVDAATGMQIGGPSRVLSATPIQTPWRKISVAPGQTRIELRYDPPGLKTGLAVGLVGWVVAILFGVLGHRTRTPVLPQEEEPARISSNSEDG